MEVSRPTSDGQARNKTKVDMQLFPAREPGGDPDAGSKGSRSSGFLSLDKYLHYVAQSGIFEHCVWSSLDFSVLLSP